VNLAKGVKRDQAFATADTAAHLWLTSPVCVLKLYPDKLPRLESSVAMGPFLRRHASVVQLLACLLTLVASGDDFNVMRAVAPATFSQIPVGALPLDDENTDFLEAQNPATPDAHRAPRDNGPAFLLSPAAGATCAAPPVALHMASPGNEHSSRAPVLTPLRC